MLNVHGKLRTEAEWCRIEDEREERARQAEREAQLEYEEADMVTYHSYKMTSKYAKQMER